jgi:RNA-directed DNA polymerase
VRFPASRLIVHRVGDEQARRVKNAIASRLADCGGLRLHPDKTRIVYCKNSTRHGRHRQVSFDFLGYTFKPRSAKRKDGTMFTTFTPAISGKAATAIRQQIRRMRFHLRSDLSFHDIAKMINTKAGAWAAYFGRFRPSETAYVLFHIDRYLLRWARRKYKHLRRAPTGHGAPRGDQKVPARTPRPLEMGTANENSDSKSRMTGGR